MFNLFKGKRKKENRKCDKDKKKPEASHASSRSSGVKKTSSHSSGKTKIESITGQQTEVSWYSDGNRVKCTFDVIHDRWSFTLMESPTSNWTVKYGKSHGDRKYLRSRASGTRDEAIRRVVVAALSNY